jgi:hypothetical protein
MAFTGKELVDAAKAMAGPTVELAKIKAIETAFDKIDTLDLKSKTAELQEYNIALKKAFGKDAEADFNAVFKNFAELNSRTRLLGVNLENVKKIQQDVREAFLFTGQDSEVAARRLQELSNVVGADATPQIKTLALNLGLTNQETLKYAQNLIRTGQAIGVGTRGITDLSAKLVSSGVAFGYSREYIKDLAVQSDVFARSIGSTGDKFVGAFGKMSTIQERTNLLGKLTTLGGRIGAIPMDLFKITSADPKEQLQAIASTFKTFRAEFQNLSDVEKNKFAQALSSALGSIMSREQVQIGLMGRGAFDAATLRRARQQAAAVGDTEFTDAELRRFTTAKAALRTAVSAAEQNVLIAGLKGLTKQTSAARATEATNAKIMSYLVTEQVKTSATTNSLIQKLNNLVDKLPENIANELKAQMGGSTTPATVTTQDILNTLRSVNFRPGFGDVQEF